VCLAAANCHDFKDHTNGQVQFVLNLPGIPGVRLAWTGARDSSSCDPRSLSQRGRMRFRRLFSLEPNCSCNHREILPVSSLHLTGNSWLSVGGNTLELLAFCPAALVSEPIWEKHKGREELRSATLLHQSASMPLFQLPGANSAHIFRVNRLRFLKCHPRSARKRLIKRVAHDDLARFRRRAEAHRQVDGVSEPRRYVCG
jgi:hypothetical protein